MSEQAIELKGAGFTLSVLQILSNDLAQVKNQLREKIAQVPQFFHMAPVILDLQAIENFQDLNGLKNLVQELNMVPIGITGCPNEYRQPANDAGLAFMSAARASGSQAKTPTASSSQTAQAASPEKTVTVEKQVVVKQAVPSKIVKQNLRSGQQIYAKDSDLIIMGAVSNGAEVIADGNIHIYGSLRGRAIAGASGRDDASIFCRKLQAELVSINGHYWTSDKLQDHWDKPARISFSENTLHISNLDN